MYYKRYLLCSFAESTLIEILKVCLLWSLWLHHLQCICIFLNAIKIFCFRVTFGTLFIISTLNTVARLFKWEEYQATFMMVIWGTRPSFAINKWYDLGQITQISQYFKIGRGCTYSDVKSLWNSNLWHRSS